MKAAKAKSDCFLDINPYSGFTGSHNGHCAAGATSKLPHSAPTHHVRVNGWCGEVCGPCAKQYEKRKDATVRQIAVSRALDIFAED